MPNQPSGTHHRIKTHGIRSSGCRPGRNTIRCALWAADIAGPGPGGYSRRRGRGEEAEMEDECGRGRFRWQPGCLPANGWRDACLNSDCGTQGASGRDLPARNKGLRGRHPAHASQLSARIRRNHCVSRRHSTDRKGKIIGAIGCSGGTDSQDEMVSKAGAAIINQVPAGTNDSNLGKR